MTNSSIDPNPNKRFEILLILTCFALFGCCVLAAEGTKVTRTTLRPYHSNEGMIDFIRISRAETCRCPCQEQEQTP